MAEIVRMTRLDAALAGELAELARIQATRRTQAATPSAPPAVEWPDAWGPEHVEMRAERAPLDHATPDLVRAYPHAPWASCLACTDGWVERASQSGPAFQIPCRCRGLRQLAQRINAAELPAAALRQNWRLDTVDWRALAGTGEGRSWAEVLGEDGAMKRLTPRLAVQAFADRWNPHRRGLLLEGPNGNGKSHLAAGLALRLLFDGVRVRWLAWPDYVARIKATFDAPGHTDEDVRRPFVECGLLVLEELGAARWTDWVGAQAEDLIYWRHMTDRPIVVTTNLALGGEAADRGTLLGYVGERAYSRLIGSCDVVHVRGRDWRTQHLASGRIT